MILLLLLCPLTETCLYSRPFVCGRLLLANVTVAATQSSGDLWEAALHSREAGRGEIGWGNRRVNKARPEGGRGRQCWCLSAGCRRHVSWTRSLDPQPHDQALQFQCLSVISDGRII